MVGLTAVIAPTSRQLRLALSRVKPASLGVQHRRILEEIAAETIDLDATGELALEVSEATIAKRLGMSPTTAGKYVDALIKARVVRWFNRVEGSAGRQARWLRVEGNFRRWAVEWSVSESEAFLMLDNAGSDHVYGWRQRQVCEHPYGWSQQDGEVPKVLAVRRLERHVVPTSMMVVTTGMFVNTVRGRAQNRPQPTPYTSSSVPSEPSSSPRSQDDDEGDASRGAVQVRRAIKRLTGQRIFDGPKGAYWTDVKRALVDVDDASWIEAALEAQGVTKWWEAVPASLALANSGDPVMRARRAELMAIRRRLEAMEAKLADAREEGDWAQIQLYEGAVTDLRAELAACETGGREVAS